MDEQYHEIKLIPKYVSMSHCPEMFLFFLILSLMVIVHILIKQTCEHKITATKFPFWLCLELASHGCYSLCPILRL
jgi:hypothetical protein